MGTDSTLLNMFRERGALLEGHFLLSSGLHSDRYLQCAMVLQFPEIALQLGEQLGEMLRQYEPDVVVAPALGGLFIAHETARALRTRSIFTERHEGEMSLRRGFQIVAGERAVVVEDVITTGKSTRETMNVVREHGGEVVAAAALIDRSGGNVNFDVPVVALATLEVPAFVPAHCPMCQEGKPLIKPGSRTSWERPPDADADDALPAGSVSG